MPLLKRKPYALSKRPKALEPDEVVFKVRITGEVFREYEDYIGRVNLYRQRVWTCKATGKTNLTYEEALLSEQRANEKIQQFPKAYIKPVLELVQFSQARLDDLVDTIFKTFKDRFVEGEEVGLKKDDGPLIRVRILHVLVDGRYEVGWIKEQGPGEEEEFCERSVEGMDTLERKKYPLQKSLLKTFIRDSTTTGLTKTAPLVVHEKLARKYGISTGPPEELRELLAPKGKTRVGEKTAEKEAKSKRKLEEQDAKALAKEAKKARREEEKEQAREEKRKAKAEEDEQKRAEDELKRIKYPIEDELVQLGPKEKPLEPRPMPSRDFAVPPELVGNLLMVWDFLMSFSKQVKLSPFALEDLEHALMHREGEVQLLVEVHYALMRVCLDDADHYERLSKKAKRATQLSLETWCEDLCNYIEVREDARGEPSELPEIAECPGLSKPSERFEDCLSALQRGHYADELEIRKKVLLLAELVEHAVQTDIIRGQLDQNWDDLQQLKALKREEDAEWRKQQREEKARARVEEMEQQGTTEGDGEIVVEEEAENGAADSDEEQEGNDDEEEDDAEGGEEEGATANGASRNGRGGSPSSSTNSALAGMSRAQARLHLLQQRAADREKEEEDRRREYEEQKRAQREKAKVQAEVNAEKKKREQEEADRQKREEHYEREFDKFFVRRKPLGLDKDHNRYWYFPREPRLFVESKDSTAWGYYQAKEELDALFTSLNPKGIRERGLQRGLERNYSKISAALSKRSRELSQKLALDEAAIRRSSRVKSTPRAAPFLAYVNKYTAGYN